MDLDRQHYYTRRLEKLEEKIRNSAIPEENKELIFKFRDYSIATSLGVSRVLKLMYTVFSFAKIMDREFERSTVEDLQRGMGLVERSPRRESTKQDYRVIIRKFYKWLRNTEEGYPPEVRFIKLRSKVNSKRLPEDLLTEEDIATLINSARIQENSTNDI